METTSFVPRPLETERSPWLRGTLTVPGDAVMTELAMAIAALCRDETTIEGAFGGPAIRQMAAALAALGVLTEPRGADWHVKGRGNLGLLAPRMPLDAGLSAQTASLLLGLCAPHDFTARIEADPELVAHFDPLLAGLRAFGATTTAAENGRLPASITGPAVAMPVELELPRRDPATKAALLLAALGSPGISRFTERDSHWNHAERMLAAWRSGILIAAAEDGSRTIDVGGLPDMRGRLVRIPGDPSLAAIGAVAASIVPSSDLTIANVAVNPTRTMFLSALVAMGANIEAHNLRIVDGEEVAELVIRQTPLHGVALADVHVATMLDELPYLAVAAAFAVGDTVLNLPNALPIEASARIAATARGLAANGIFCEATEEAFVISGTGEVRGRGRVITGQDPVIGMAFLVLGMAAREQVTIDDQTGIEERFPGFVASFEAAGASFVHLT